MPARSQVGRAATLQFGMRSTPPVVGVMIKQRADAAAAAAPGC